MPPGNKLANIYNKFDAEGSFLSGRTFGTGHIHDTYKIETAPKHRDYILQRLNTGVFHDIPGLQENIFRITSHIKSKLSEEGEKNIDRKCLSLIVTPGGNTWIKDDRGDYWRMYIFIDNHHSYDVVRNTAQAYEGGRAIGHFQRLLSDMPGPRLNETIPFFHDVEDRLLKFRRALEKDTAGRAEKVRNETDFVFSREEEMKTIEKLGRQGKIPLRITHNDTKFNNILLDDNDKALCIIDLDTVMPGYVHYDFGDSVRTVASMAPEDEEDLSKVYMNMDLYESFTRGYLQQISSVLNETEIAYLAYAPSLMAFIMGLRFLTDYIDGDTYYKISRKDHNIIRSRAQFRLVENFEMELESMKTIISDIIN